MPSILLPSAMTAPPGTATTVQNGLPQLDDQFRIVPDRQVLNDTTSPRLLVIGPAVDDTVVLEMWSGSSDVVLIHLNHPHDGIWYEWKPKRPSTDKAVFTVLATSQNGRVLGSAQAVIELSNHASGGGPFWSSVLSGALGAVAGILSVWLAAILKRRNERRVLERSSYLSMISKAELLTMSLETSHSIRLNPPPSLGEVSALREDRKSVV